MPAHALQGCSGGTAPGSGRIKGGLSDGEPRCEGKKRGASGESARTGGVCRPGWSAGGRTGGGGDGAAEWEPVASDCWLARVKLS